MSTLERDLSQGHVVKQLILFSLPFLLSNFIQSMYSVADMIIVGQFSGTASISGVNIGGQITFILTNLIFGLVTGSTILVAQYLGANKRDDIVETIGTVLSLLLSAAVVMTVLVLALQHPLLRLIQTPSESYGEAQSYLQVTATGIVFIFGYNALSAIMRGMGDSKHPMMFVAIACVTNIILDLVLVGWLGMQARGAALATVFSQALSMILCVAYLARNGFIFDFKLKSFRFYRDKLMLILKLGIPMSIQNVVTGFSFLILTAVINVIGGVEASAAVGAAGKFNSFGIMPAIAMSMAVSTMAAQNIGAKQFGRVKQTLHAGIGIALGFSIIVFCVSQLFPEQVLRVFGSDPLMLKSGATYLRAFSYDYLLVPFVFCLNGLCVGSGSTRFSMLNNMLAAIILRVPAAVLLATVFGLGITGIGLGAPIASVGSMCLGLWFYLSGRWLKKHEDDTTLIAKSSGVVGNQEA